MRFHVLRRALLLALAGSCQFAAAQSAAPALHPRFVDPAAAKPASRAPANLTAVTDKTPPALTAFNAPASFDVGVHGARLSVAFKATDDSSGVQRLSASARGPNGHTVYVYFEAAVPSTALSGRMHHPAAEEFLEPGVYTFDSVYIRDFAFNSKDYDAAALAALGNVSFTVKNDRGYDSVPAELKSGEVLTKTISLSSTAPGTGEAPFVRVKISGTDAGNTVVSGIRSMSAQFCTLDMTAMCIDVQNGELEGGSMETSTTMKLGGHVWPGGFVEGVYHLRTVRLWDYAGNVKEMYSTKFGGETDFSAYFPSTTIKLVP